ncbi:MAG TPA: hypothetical protein VM686_21710 [Polyangiaceae bacterium]|jgi:hypothetical protein|nr:hypothetical protein [Polyangiaceae bacterium]
MVKHALAFAAAFGMSLALGSLTGCAGEDDCTCLPVPARPEVQSPLTDLTVASYDSVGNSAESPIIPEAGTLEVTGESVVITYQQASVTFRVEYDVVGPR